MSAASIADIQVVCANAPFNRQGETHDTTNGVRIQTGTDGGNVDRAWLVGLGWVRDALTARLLRRDGHATYTLDADATLVVGEKRNAHWSYTGEQGYMPMLGFLFETPLCLV